MSIEDDAEYGLVMPLIVCQSNGGPYEDAAFVAGTWFGRLDAELAEAAKTGREMTVDFAVPSALVPQLDLLAMHRGYAMTADPWGDHPDEHTFVTFAKVASSERFGDSTEGGET